MRPPKTATGFAAAVAAFRAGTDTPRAYLERCLEVIDARESVVRAFTTLDLARARQQADASTRRYAEGRPLSPVDGMPLGVKDLFESRDELTEGNSAVHQGWKPKRDAACITGLRELGAYHLGKTTTSELGAGVAPATTNPLDTSRSPGGSSSGSAAAVAAAMVPAAIGTQVAGSVVRPASFCGVVGYKPSYGAIHRGGGIGPVTSVSTIGVIAAELDDAWDVARLLSATIGPDPGWRPLAAGPYPVSTGAALRLGLLEPPGWENLALPLKQAFNAFVDRLRSRGVVVRAAGDTGALERLALATTETTTHHARLCRFEGRWPLRQYGPAGLLSEKLLRISGSQDWMTPGDYAEVLDRRDAYRTLWDAIFTDVDAMVTLTVDSIAPKGLADMGATAYQVPASFAGVPALSLPLLTIDGMPLGVQLIGRFGHDAQLVTIARQIALQ